LNSVAGVAPSSGVVTASDARGLAAISTSVQPTLRGRTQDGMGFILPQFPKLGSATDAEYVTNLVNDMAVNVQQCCLLHGLQLY